MNILRGSSFSFRPCIALAATVLAVSIGAAHAQDQANALTGNDMLPFCRQYAQGRYTEFGAGWCAATVTALVYAAPQVCAPNNATFAQSVLVVIRYIELRPARMNQTFLRLASEALIEAWPCSR